jgi:hypothetical protein
MDTVTTTKTRCEVLDQIVEWTRPDGTLNIEAGDLILEYGKLQQIACITLVDDGGFVRYELEGVPGPDFAAPTDMVAVRRYIETAEEDGSHG